MPAVEPCLLAYATRTVTGTSSFGSQSRDRGQSTPGRGARSLQDGQGLDEPGAVPPVTESEVAARAQQGQGRQQDRVDDVLVDERVVLGPDGGRRVEDRHPDDPAD